MSKRSRAASKEEKVHFPESEPLLLAPSWRLSKVFSKVATDEWRTCDAGTRCTPGSWFKVRVENLLELSAKVVRRKDGVLGYCEFLH